MKPNPSVLIIQTAFLGDVILATALIESIRSEIPEATIDFLVRNGNESLLQGNPGLRRVLILDKKRKYRSLRELSADFRRQQYDYIINVQRFATTGILTILSGGTVTIGFSKNPFSFLFTHAVPHPIGDVHEVMRNQALLTPMGIKTSARPRLYPSKEQVEKVKSFKSSPYITVSPASVWFTKQWPAAQWIAFLSRVQGLRVFLLGSVEDRDLCQRIADELNGDPTNLAGQLSLLESAALMTDARMNFVNDSAPMHLASAVNAPVTAVYCSTIPAFGFGPLSDLSAVVETEEKLDCRPCGLHGFRACPQGHFRCATTIKAEQLLGTLGQL